MISTLDTKITKFLSDHVDTTMFVDAHYPALLTLFYLLIVYISINSKKKNSGARKNTTFLFCIRVFTIFHNIFMSLFSLYIFVNLYPHFTLSKFKSWESYGKFICSHLKFREGELELFYWLFYVSKFYEFMDTFIIIAKGYKPSFLQYYHHSGVVLVMWSNFRFKLQFIYFICLYNAFIHTIMYFYYFLATLHIRINFVKPIITTMQLLQFILGTILTLPGYYQKNCINGIQKVVFVLSNLYVLYLILLFGGFFVNNYIRKARKKSV